MVSEMKFDARWLLNRLKENVTWGKYNDAYKNNTEFTEIITDEIRDIIMNAGFGVSKEYLRIDVTGWRDKKEEVSEKCKKVDMNPHLWDLHIAVEHENDKKDWYDELIKLMHIRCPLKVIISYADHETRDNAEQGDTAKLSIAADLIKKTIAYSNAESSHEEIMIILGNGGKGCEDIGYRGYLFDYTNSKFLRIENMQ